MTGERTVAAQAGLLRLRALVWGRDGDPTVVLVHGNGAHAHWWAPINVPVVNQGDWEPAPLSPEDQARVPKDLSAPYPGEINLTAPAGSAVILNSSGWHSGTRKNSDAPRRLLHLTYTRRDLPQQLTQIDYLTRELDERMSPEHRFLLDIEPKRRDETMRMPKRDAKGWWN